VGANVDDVVEGIGADTRIGAAFLKPGPGWGGSCFPKDSRALVKIAADYGYDFTMMKGVIDVNDEQKRRMIAKVRRAVGIAPGRGLTGTVVGVLGLTFKAGTDDLRDSPSITMVSSLVASGATVQAFDPTVETEPAGPKATLLTGVRLVESAREAAAGAHVLMIATEWPEFAKIDLEELRRTMRPGAVVVDTRNLLDPAAVRAAGLGYDGVGRP
jgi:UDPglucose 6-dehydrogenase